LKAEAALHSRVEELEAALKVAEGSLDVTRTHAAKLEELLKAEREKKVTIDLRPLNTISFKSDNSNESGILVVPSGEYVNLGRLWRLLHAAGCEVKLREDK